jgi:cell division protein FtsI (penicillin-binding protein 3)
LEPSLEPKAARRVRNLARFALLWALILVGRLIHLQVYRHPELSQIALDQHTGEWEVQAPRGRICDSTGQILAISVPVESVFIDPRPHRHRQGPGPLSPILNLDPEPIHDKMASA